MTTTDINTHYGKNIKWTVYRNGYNAFIGVLTLNGSVYDISSRVFTAYIRTPEGSQNKLTLTEGDGLTNGGTAGTLTVVLTEEDLASLPRDRYFIVIEYPISGKGDFPLVQGFISIVDETNPGSTTTSATIPVSIDGTTVSMAVTLAGGSGGSVDEDFTTLTDGATVAWDMDDKQFPLGKLTSTQSFTLNMTNVKSGASGVLKLITDTASAITLTFDTDFTNKALNSTITTYTFPALTGQEYFLSFIVDGTTIEWVIAEAECVSDPGGSNDDFLQRKTGEWTNRTLSQVLTDFALITDVAIHADALAGLTLTNMTSAEQSLPVGNSLHIVRFDLTKYKSLRISCRVGTGSASANNPRMYAQYTTDLTGATGWTTIGAGTIASNEAISLVSIVFNQVTSWTTIPAGAKADVLLRLATAGGDGAADPVIYGVHLQLRTA